MTGAELANFLAILAAALLIALSATVIGYMREAARHIRDRRLRHIALMLVQAAEQKFGAGGGPDKFAWVQRAAEAMGIELSEAQIEAAVRLLKASGMEVQYEESGEPVVAASAEG